MEQVYGEPHAPLVSYTILQVFKFTIKQGRRPTGLFLTGPSNAVKNVPFLVQSSGCLMQAQSVQTERATAAQAYLWAFFAS